MKNGIKGYLEDDSQSSYLVTTLCSRKCIPKHKNKYVIKKFSMMIWIYAKNSLFLFYELAKEVLKMIFVCTSIKIHGYLR